jgi:hypothetical protein
MQGFAIAQPILPTLRCTTVAHQQPVGGSRKDGDERAAMVTSVRIFDPSLSETKSVERIAPA